MNKIITQMAPVGANSARSVESNAHPSAPAPRIYGKTRLVAICMAALALAVPNCFAANASPPVITICCVVPHQVTAAQNIGLTTTGALDLNAAPAQNAQFTGLTDVGAATIVAIDLENNAEHPAVAATHLGALTACAIDVASTPAPDGPESPGALNARIASFGACASMDTTLDPGGATSPTFTG